ncbi:hypothetical protein ACFFGH_28575 [Lysobacter korlensis]|uniref:Uncharacterized protein n=1 Tax=Lysobacter korlensis TaxID=553636 RepID=A0ABV6RXV7_9GAMM
MEFPIAAGMLSTALFAASNLPMVLKAARMRDLRSYSLGNLALINAANGVHSLYVFNLPIGPIWLLHGLYLVASAVMLAMFIRFSRHAEPSPHHSNQNGRRSDGHGTIPRIVRAG